MVAAEPVKPDTYTRFLQAFQPYGLKSESFFVAYGLAENTLAVSLRWPQYNFSQQERHRAGEGAH